MTEPTRDPEILRRWIGRQESRSDTIDPRPARLMQATLDMDGPPLAAGDVLPPLWHWLYFSPDTPTAGLAADGHPRLGGFLPPVDLPRRMWAGGRLEFHAPLRIYDWIERRSEILSVTLKEGRTGPLCFVTVRHGFWSGGTLMLAEEHDIVYRGMPAPGDAPPEPPAPPALEPDRDHVVTPSMPLLFRYSALTFNGHRIHYDIDYCRSVEGYPGCIVHGPLIATLLAGLAEDMAGKPLARFAFRASAPLFHQDPFRIRGAREGDGITVWAETPGGGLAMKAEAVAG